MNTLNPVDFLLLCSFNMAISNDTKEIISKNLNTENVTQKKKIHKCTACEKCFSWKYPRSASMPLEQKLIKKELYRGKNLLITTSVVQTNL